MSLALAAAILLSSCSAGDDPDADVQEAEDPLVEFLEIPSPEEAAAIAEVRLVREQEAIAACMRESGFEYETHVPPVEVDDFRGTPAEATDEQQRFVEEYGFGITTDPPTPADDGGDADPNTTYVESLSPAELTAYQTALYGMPLEELTVIDSTDPDGIGCLHVGYREGAPAGLPDAAVWEEYRSILADIQTRTLESGEVLNASADYKSCMRAEGFEGIDDPDSVFSYIESRWAELSDMPLADGLKELKGSMAVRSIQQIERSVATADLHCLEDWNEIYGKVKRQIELEVIAQNAELLGQLRGYALSTR